MDFDYAATRLKKDQDALRSRARRPQTLASANATKEAKKRQEYRLKELQKRKQKERVEKLTLDYVQRGFDIVEARLGVVRNLHFDENGNFDDDTRAPGRRLMLEATSIYGQGDKITLPQSLLSTLATRDLLHQNQERGQPLFFRLGIPRPEYSFATFPASSKMKHIMHQYKNKVMSAYNAQSSHIADGSNDIIIDDDDYNEDLEINDNIEWEEAYLDELSHEYMSYVYATVIEFTQDEGFIGLPKNIAELLLSPKTATKLQVDAIEASDTQMTIQVTSSLPSKFSVDPALVSVSTSALGHHDKDEANTTTTTTAMMDSMDVDNHYNRDVHTDENDLETKTPGHPAYGHFPIPIDKIEVSLLTHIPLGNSVTLQPTKEAIQNGFYNLKDVKLALEQSLIRTRGCLNLGDIVHCWNRGKKFDLRVKDLSPSHVGAISCVNTDVEVDIVAAEMSSTSDSDDMLQQQQLQQPQEQHGKWQQSSGQVLGRQQSILQSNNANDNNTASMMNTTSSTSTSTTNLNNNNTANNNSSSSNNNNNKDWYEIIAMLKMKDIPIEPPINQKENVITIQIRGDNGNKQSRRRFDTSISTMEDLFSFVVSENLVIDTSCRFCLVSRIPRRVFNLEDHGNTLLADMNFSQQELFLIEKKS